MNSKGSISIVFLTFMLAIVIVILALAFAPIAQSFADDARDATNMDCANSSISDFDRVACTATDLNPFLYVGIMVFVAFSIIGIRVLIK